MDSHFQAGGYAAQPYDYLDGRPVVFMADGYPIQYQPAGPTQHAQQTHAQQHQHQHQQAHHPQQQQQPQHVAFYPVQDMYSHDPSMTLLHGFAPFDVTAQQTKHRRSRNGCYTCRTRRVKCDENRPSCERCRKGSRKCVYPLANDDAKQKSKARRKGSSSQDPDPFPPPPPSGPAMQPDQPTSPADTSTLAIEGTSPPASSVSPNLLHSSTSPHLTLTPQTSNDDHSRADTVSLINGRASPDDSSLNVSLPRFPPRAGSAGKPKFYLDYLGSAITHHHYGLSHPCPELIPTFLVSSSFHFRPLLHAVVAFAAYHYAVHDNADSLQDFIFHYAESVALLREHLAHQRGGTEVYILLTILQLATIEEYLGDWANLINHQLAAAKVIFTIYTPESIFDPSSRIPASKIFDWYYHFDLFASFIAGKGTTITREWYEAQHRHALQLVAHNPDSLDLMLLERHSAMRIVGCDCTVFFEELKAGTLSPRAIKERAADLTHQLDAILIEADPRIVDRTKVRVHTPEAPPLSPGSTLDLSAGGNPWDPIEYHSGPLWSVNYLNMRIWGIKLMMLNHLRRDGRSATSSTSPTPPPGSTDSRSSQGSPASAPSPSQIRPKPGLQRYALLILRMFSAITTHDPDPGAIMGAQAGLSFASSFVGLVPPSTSMPPGFDLARAHAHSAWCRARLRDVELRGYVYPMAMRKRAADAWAVDVASQGWWFPNGAGLKPVIRAIREFVVFRTRPPEDQLGEDMREMNGLFASMQVGAGSGGESSCASEGEDDASAG